MSCFLDIYSTKHPGWVNIKANFWSAHSNQIMNVQFKATHTQV